jgi:hypothetical protein
MAVLRAVVAANKPISKAGSRARLAVPAIILRAVAEWREFSMRAVIASWRRGWLDPRATGRRRPRRSGAQAQRERWAINQRAPGNDGRAPPTLADLGSAYPRGPIKSGAAFRRSGSGADVEKAAAAFKRDCSRRYTRQELQGRFERALRFSSTAAALRAVAARASTAS